MITSALSVIFCYIFTLAILLVAVAMWRSNVQHLSVKVFITTVALIACGLCGFATWLLMGVI